MRPSSHLLTLTLATTAVALPLIGTAAPAQAATGQVVVFSNEIQPLDTYTDPTGCHSLRPGAHSVDNQTDGPVKLYADPFCLTEVITIQPGHGAHVPPSAGSFSA
ncbi:hypothetical protein [Streptosporangium sandarakinum]|uniref:hypothetical protein n=1 Tax=Streptosporangium sandarakinum TaxID=1260955 RepID=UPI0033B420E8